MAVDSKTKGQRAAVVPGIDYTHQHLDRGSLNRNVRRRALGNPSYQQQQSPRSRLCFGILDTDSEDDDRPDYYIEIPGSRVIFGQSIRNLHRTFWIVLVVIFFGLAVVQVQERINFYLKTPVDINLVVINNDTLTFPRVTICTREPFNYTTLAKLRPVAAKALGIDPALVRLPYDLLSITNNLSALWDSLGHDMNVMTKECWFGRNRSCDDSGKWTRLFTVMGLCSYYEADFPVKETGSFNGLYMQMDGNRLTKPAVPQDQVASLAGFGLQQLTADNGTLSSGTSVDVSTFGWTYYVHPADEHPALAVFQRGDYMNPSSSVDVTVNLEQMTNLNVWHTPCVGNEVGYTEANCELHCLSEEIIRRAGCRLPFMPTDASALIATTPLCGTPDAYLQADMQLQLLIKASQWNVTSCNCTRGCHKLNYSPNKEKVLADVKPNRLRLRVFYQLYNTQDRTFEEVSEAYAYNIITLFCDIGNSIGLLLGASVLTLLQTVEWSAHFIFGRKVGRVETT